MFPAMGKGDDAYRQYQQKLASNPWGLLIYHPPGWEGMTWKQLLTEFLTELAETLVGLLLLLQTRLQSFRGRVAFLTGVGLAAAISNNVSYWNWYGFPLDFTASAMFIEVAGFFAAGLAVAAVLGRGPAAAAAAR